MVVMNYLHKVRDRVGRHETADAAQEDRDEGTLPGITDNIAFNADAQSNDVKTTDDSKIDRVKDKFRVATHAVAHPQQAAKQWSQKAMLKAVVPNERPWLDDQTVADDQLFEAYDQLNGAKAEHGKAPAGDGSAVLIHDAQRRVQLLEEQRTELEVAWHMSRYVRRARVVRRPLDFPVRERYRQYTPTGKYERFLWVKWIGHVRSPTLMGSDRGS